MILSPFEVYGILMGINREQTQGGMKIRGGESGKRESYATLNVMTSTTDRIVGELGRNQALQAMVRILGGTRSNFWIFKRKSA